MRPNRLMSFCDYVYYTQNFRWWVRCLDDA